MLIACGTRGVIDAVFAPTSDGEPTCATRLLSSLRAGMIVLADRNGGGQPLLEKTAATEADPLVRVTNNRLFPVGETYRDGSWRSRAGRLDVRVIRCEITITTDAGRKTGYYLLVSTLLDPAIPATDLVRLYHNWWLIEIDHSQCICKWPLCGGQAGARAGPGVDGGPAGYAAVVYIQGQIGIPYLWGGDGPQLTELPGGQVRVAGGFDCSGLTRAAYAAAGVELPRTAQQQYEAGPLVPAGSSPQPGDLVFFGTGPHDVTHVGIAISATHMIDAPHKGAVVRVEPIWTNLVGMTRPVPGGSP